MNEHYERAEGLLKPAIYRTPGTYINAGPADGEEIAPEPATVYRALAEAQLAVAFELRTANILAAQATPDWLNDARVRMGAEPFPPVRDFSTPGPTPPAPVKDPRCELQLMDGRNEIRCWLPKDHDGECK